MTTTTLTTAPATDTPRQGEIRALGSLPQRAGHPHPAWHLGRLLWVAYHAAPERADVMADARRVLTDDAMEAFRQGWHRAAWDAREAQRAATAWQHR